MKKKKGFTLVELLIVVAIIAVLVAIAIPVFTSQLHKARVAADMANVRSYYSKLQYEFLQNDGVYDDSLITNFDGHLTSGKTSFILDGNTVKLTEGYLWIAKESDQTKGYNLYYICKKGDHELTLPND